MDILEKAAYLKGLADGLGIAEDSKEGKLLLAVLDMLGDIADNLDGLETGLDIIADQVECIDEELDCLFGDCDCDHDDFPYDEDFEGDIYQVTCPKCLEEIYLDEEMLDEGELICPACGENLELDFDGALED